MVRKIVWTSRAELIFSRILEYYFKRNGTKTYSQKLNSELKKIIKLLLKHPYLGRKTETANVHVLVKGDFKLFYMIEPAEIIILLVWDCRQDPADLKIS